MCNYNIDMTNPKTNFYRYGPGDRILVHKYIYQVSEPRRWDVVVFKAPQDPNTNYIKRLIGLPNESIRLLDGNVYYQKEGEELWHIARKGDSPKGPASGVAADLSQPVHPAGSRGIAGSG